MENEVNLAVEIIGKSKWLAALTGAGLSVESGVPPFRGPEGIWARYGQPKQADEYPGFLENPNRWWERRLKPGSVSNILFETLKRIEPNPAHHTLAELEARGILRCIITQNIDGLLQKAGCKRVVELHGNAYKLRCIECGSRFEKEGFPIGELPPRCSSCGGLIKYDDVCFGEPIPMDFLRKAQEHSVSCDCMLVVGTSGLVYPAASFPVLAENSGASLIEINPERTRLTGLCEVSIREKAGEVLPAIAKKLPKPAS